MIFSPVIFNFHTEFKTPKVAPPRVQGQIEVTVQQSNDKRKTSEIFKTSLKAIFNYLEDSPYLDKF